jgi:hypothetical protein
MFNNDRAQYQLEGSDEWVDAGDLAPASQSQKQTRTASSSAFGSGV